MPASAPLVRCLTALAALSLGAVAARPVRADVPGPIPMLAPAPSGIRAPPPPIVGWRPLAETSPGQQCRKAIRAAERAGGIPEQLMAAIGRVESGRREADGTVNPWPWSINAEGEDHIYETKAQAIAAVRALQANGMRSIDVGCMQVNLMHHPDAFATLDAAFDPVANADYAARFLLQLHAQTGTWPTATAWYHSATPELGADYERKVMAVWPEEKLHPEDTRRQDLASAWAATGTPAFGWSPAPFNGSFGQARASGLGRIIPQASGTVGRDLAAYRAGAIPRPIPLAPRRPDRVSLLHTVSNGG